MFVCCALRFQLDSDCFEIEFDRANGKPHASDIMRWLKQIAARNFDAKASEGMFELFGLLGICRNTEQRRIPSKSERDFDTTNPICHHDGYRLLCPHSDLSNECWHHVHHIDRASTMPCMEFSFGLLNSCKGSACRFWTTLRGLVESQATIAFASSKVNFVVSQLCTRTHPSLSWDCNRARKSIDTPISIN